ncbi:hypothetical protein B0H11DRAFT_1921221 [Mycena galericulata]|nr:hypothetical protein B0H11DRAFT_1921221 [Mycena galericulata]
MPADPALSTLLDGGYFVVSYDLPLENAYAVLPVLNGPTSQGEPALSDSRASTYLEHTDSAFLSGTVTPKSETTIKTNDAQSEQPKGMATLDLEEADFEPIDIDRFRMETLKQTVSIAFLLRADYFPSTQLRRIAIRKTKQSVISYVWYSTVAPDLSTVQEPQGWKEVHNGRTAALLFMTWPQGNDIRIWIHSPELRWETVNIGDEFGSDAGEWKRKEGSGEYILEVDDHAVKLIRKESRKRSAGTQGAAPSE